jgi:hypothetical protein
MSEAPAPRPAPIVDPSPAQAPIQLGPTEYVFPPAAASPDDVLALKPNTYRDATAGPHAQVSATGYTSWTKPDGSTFIAPVANDETYARKGFTRGATQDIPDLVAYLAEQAAKEPAAPKSSKST